MSIKQLLLLLLLLLFLYHLGFVKFVHLLNNNDNACRKVTTSLHREFNAKQLESIVAVVFVDASILIFD
jgi:hypothetical protein